MEPRLIEDVVQSVLRELRGTSPAPSGTGPNTASGQLRIDDAVVTEGTLTNRLTGVREVVFSPGTVLTPTARDLLRSRRIPWTRAGSSAGDAQTAATGPTVIVTHSTIAVGTAFRSANLVRVSPEKAIRTAVDGGGSTPLLILTDRPHAMAMELNRTSSLRAIAVSDAADIAAMIRESRANCIVAKPNGCTVDDLKSLARAVSLCEASS